MENNTLPQTPPQATPAAAPALLQAHVEYLPGITIFGAESALLEWSADNRIKFFKMDPNTNTATSLLFDVPVSEIEGVSGSMVLLTMKVAGKKYNAQFSTGAIPKMAIGGVVGMALAAQDTKASGINLWINKFKENGVSTKGFMGWGWTIKAALIAVAIIFVIVIIVVIASVA